MTSLVATCHALVGWTWARPLTRPLVFPRLSFLGRFLKAFSSLHLDCLSHLCIISILCDFVTPPFFELRPPCSSFFRYGTFPFLISLCFALNRGFFLCIFFHFFLMYEYSEVRCHCPSVSFLFARLGAFLGSSSGYPEVMSFASEAGALGLVLADLSHLLRQFLDWFKFVRTMSTKVRSSELDTSLSSSDKAIKVDIAVPALPSLNPSSSSPTVLRAFHGLKEVCSLDEDTHFRFRDRFQIPGETKFRLPHSGEKACAFNPGEVSFYEDALLSGLRFPVHPSLWSSFAT